MIFDMDALLLEPTYTMWGIDAVFTDKSATERTVRILDHRDGTNITAARGYTGATSILPRGINAEDATIMMKQSEIPERPTGWTVSLPHEDGEMKTYRISSCKTKGRPGSGEWVCTLKEA